MNNIIIFLLLLIFLNHNYCFSQKHVKAVPISYNYKSSKNLLTNIKDIDTKVMPPVNTDSLDNYEKELDKSGVGRAYRFGFAFDVKYNFLNSGTWDNLENGGRLWRLRLICPNAYTINLIFSKYHLADSAKLFIYNESKTYKIGAFTSLNNKIHNRFATDLVEGDTILLEFYEPKEVIGKSEIEISKINHDYKDALGFKKKIKESINKHNEIQTVFDCHDDINCTEGVDWWREKYSVARIILDGSQLCSGALLNYPGLNFDDIDNYIAYFLTAFHCWTDDLSHRDDPENKTHDWVFEFGEIHEECDGTTFLPIASYTDADKVSGWGGYPGTTDFLLLSLNEKPYPGDNENFPGVYFCGWDKSTNIPLNTTCIHFRPNEPLKIALDNNPPNLNYPQMWETNIYFGLLTHGSSGSPLFDSYHRIIGQLNGANDIIGCASSYPRQGPNKYGRFDLSWGLDRVDREGLHKYLDPENTGITHINGQQLPFTDYGVIYEGNNSFQINVMRDLYVGSGKNDEQSLTTLPFRLEANNEMVMQAGSQIVIRPCTQIINGSTFRAYIDPNSSNQFTNNNNIYNDDCGEYSEQMMQQPHYSNKNSNNSITSLFISPNPVLDKATIEFNLSNKSNISLIITNLFGEVVTSFERNTEYSQGSHKIDYYCSGIPSGMYFITLRTPENIITKKLMVVK